MRPLAMTLIAVVLSACGAERIVSSTAMQPLRPSQRADLISSAREVVVVGQPPDGSSPEALAALMRFPGARNERAFTVIEPPGSGTRLVVTFGPPGSGACIAPKGAAIGMPLVMTMTYCSGRSINATATMRSDTLVGPSDPAFASAMDRLMMSISQAEPRRFVD